MTGNQHSYPHAPRTQLVKGATGLPSISLTLTDEWLIEAQCEETLKSPDENKLNIEKT